MLKKTIRIATFVTVTALCVCGCDKKTESGGGAADVRASGASIPSQAKADHERIQGNWIPVAVHEGEQAMGADEGALRQPWRFSAGTIEGVSERPASYILSPEEMPKTLVIHRSNGGRTIKALYELNGDELKVMFFYHEDEPLPPAILAAKTLTPTLDTKLFAFRRAG